MKTEKLLSVSMIATLLAACSNEVEIPGATDGNNDANRPSAGKVVIKTNVVEENGDAESRSFWTGNGWKFEEGDRFGAMLMDTWNQTNEGHTTVADYTFTDYIHTNYPFTSNATGDVWTCPEDAAVNEGNYFFYFPYDGTYKERGYVRISLNNEQSNVDSTTGEVDWSYGVRDNQKYLGYAFIPASNDDINEVPVNFYPLFATPKFKLQNLSSTDLRLVKLIIRTHTNDQLSEPCLLPTTVALAPLSSNFKEVAADYPTMEEDKQIASLYYYSTLMLDGIFAKDPVKDSELKSDKTKGVYEYTVDFGDKYIVQPGEFFKACAVMPAGDYNDFDVYAFVEMQNSEKTSGFVSLTDLKNSHWSGFDTQNGAMQYELKPGVTQVLNASFDSNALQNLSWDKFTVANTDDLLWMLNLKAKHGGNELLVVKTLGDKVELNNEVYNWLKDEAHKNIKLQIIGNIVIPANVPADAIDLLTTGKFTNALATTIINKGNQVIEKDLINCNVQNYGTLKGNVSINGYVQNAENATIEVTTVNGDVENAGEVVIKSVNGNVKNGYNATIDTVNGNINNYDNGGKLIIKNVTGTLSNTGEVTINGGTLNEVNNGQSLNSTIKVEDETTIKHLVNNKYGKVYINADSKLGSDNYGLIEINSCTVTPLLDKDSQKDIFNAPSGIIKVINGTLKYTSITRVIYNDGNIYVIGKSYVAIYGGTGIIDVTEANRDENGNLIEEGGYQAISYDVEKTYFRYRGQVNTKTLQAIISSKNYGKNPVILEFEKDATQADLNGANVQKILVKSGATLKLEGKWSLEKKANGYELGNSYEALEVEEGATLKVVNGKTLEAVKEFDILANGTFRAENNSIIKGFATFKGNGVVFISTKDFSWNQGAFTGEWTWEY